MSLKENLMEFCDALVYLKTGSKIERKIWGGRRFIFIGSGPIGMKTLLFESSTGDQGTWLASNMDILADDWIVVKDKDERKDSEV